MQYRAVWTSRMKQVLVLQRPLSGYGSALEEQAWCGCCQRASKPLLCGPTFHCYQHRHLLDINLLAWSVYYTNISLCGVYLPTQELISQYCLIYSTSWISSSPPQRDGGPMLLSLPSWEWGWLHSEPAELTQWAENCFSTTSSVWLVPRANELNQTGLLPGDPQEHRNRGKK